MPMPGPVILFFITNNVLSPAPNGTVHNWDSCRGGSFIFLTSHARIKTVSSIIGGPISWITMKGNYWNRKHLTANVNMWRVQHLFGIRMESQLSEFIQTPQRIQYTLKS